MIAPFSVRPNLKLNPYAIPNPNRVYLGQGQLVLFSPQIRSNQGFKFQVSANQTRMDWIRKIPGGCFPVGNPRKRELKVEKDSGGEDVFDAEVMGSVTKPEHLVVMVNGIIGSAADWKFAAEQFVKKFPDEVIVHRSERNYSKLTFDGVDLMGERLAEEVLSVIRNRTGVRKISFVAHSLGGLVARYAVGKLYEQSPEAESRKENGIDCRIAGLEPMNFVTFATPHLGSRGHRQFPILCGLPFLEKRASRTAHLVAGRTGKHLFLMDNEDEKPPLLLRMVTDSHELKFMSGLQAFKRCVAYANVNYDYMVGWRTSSIRRQNELPKRKILAADTKYPHIVHVEGRKTDNVSHKPSISVQDKDHDLEEEMIRGLAQVPWERVDVSFHKSRQRYAAHSTIQVKSLWLNSDGIDVVSHMMDNFLF